MKILSVTRKLPSGSRSSRIKFADAECIGDAIDVVEPGRDQRDLQDAHVIEADGAEPAKVVRCEFVRCPASSARRSRA